MKLDHKKIDYVATAIFLFNFSTLIGTAAQILLRNLLNLWYQDSLLVLISVMLSLFAARKHSVTTLLQIIHRIFGLNI